MEEKINSGTSTLTIGEELDRLEVPAGKIGLNSPGQSIALLKGLDAVYARMQALNPDSQSRKIVETQFEVIVARLKSEAGRFLRDVGGVQALRRERQEVNPPRDHEWWYLDELVLERSKKTLRRGLITGGAVVALLLVLALLYNAFLAPDPKVAAVYSHQSSAQDSLIAGDLDAAKNEAEQGLKIDPRDAGLLVTKGVVLDIQGQTEQAAQIFSEAQQYTGTLEEFHYLRGQAYLMAQQPEKALADAQEAARINPKFAQAYLLSGQVYEITQQTDLALKEYDLAYALAGENKQTELQALARMRTAMLLQSAGSGLPTLDGQVTPTP